MNTVDALRRQRYVLLETRKRDGTWVGTPVSLAEAGGKLYFRTYDAAGKSKRLRNFPDCRITPSTLRGRPVGEPVTGTATLLSGADADRARAALAAKHPVLHGWLVPWSHRVKGWATLHYEFRPGRP